ncbi:MAG: histidine phosphatase family protein, partial [Planctomycetota bacterium]|nr:histidine phosphatase family protein [Planctomycetota bacterium]
MNLHIVRHGESESNAGLSEDIDSGLTALGLRQAEHIAAQLAQDDVTAILCSPFRRAIDTAMPLCTRSAVAAELFPDACEWFSGEWPVLKPFNGRRLAAIADCYPPVVAPTRGDGTNWWPNWPEPRAQFNKRCTRAVEEMREKFDQPNANVVV